jgi:exodeoxyribonuclease-3
MEGYESYFSFAGKKGYSGTALYTKLPPFSVKTKGFPAELEGEGRIVEAHFQDFILFNVYFPNGQMNEARLQYKLRFYDSFLEYIGPYQQKGNHLIITGDFNTAHQPIDLAEPEKHTKTSGFLACEREKIDEYLQHDLIDIFRVRHPDLSAYTYWSYFANARVRNLGWRIDYYLISPALTSLVEVTPIHHDIMGSDHCPLSIILR